ncbi:hypothetical protein LKL35_29310 [Streptomyces sp. ET3-23]|uniref:hypothetical protein n=1 Tax=Streptomyces sp. ET3-23 TaxID=2885643 RepID=UPI001D121180|nr:hypothetical protein [Streptomyces sp. ET3-23]MCC2279498.1 hypothetical protein [Streptomyces sp. ET3-23]
MINIYVYHWALIEYGEKSYVQVVKTTKGEIAAQEAAWNWGRRNLSPDTVRRATVRYLGQSEPLTRH